jgi:P4 family phage/plasmid primase-like protien
VDGEKKPKTPRGFKDAVPNPFFVSDSDGVGISTGQMSGLVVVDLDEKDGKHGIQAFKDLMTGRPEIITRTVKTPTGGAHLYFKHSGPLKTRINHPVPGIDFKADGGYIVAPPSVVKNGDFYSIVRDIDPVTLPDWLKEIMTGPGRDEQPLTAGTAVGSPGQTRPAVKPYVAPAKITAGSRNDTLYRIACSLAAKRIGDTAVLAAVREENKNKCVPPLEESEVLGIVQHACDFNRKSPAVNPTRVTPSMTETAAAAAKTHTRILLTPEIEALIEESHINTAIAKSLNANIGIDAAEGGIVRFNTTDRSWYVWDDTRWLKDERSEVLRLAWDHVCQLMLEATQLRNVHVQRQLVKAQSSAEINHALALLQSVVSITSNDFDADDTLLNCRNGTIDLISGTLRTFDRKNLITRLAPVDYIPGATCPKWESHLNVVFENDLELVDAFKRIMGYALIGGNGENKFFILYGRGKNGKSVTVNAVSLVLGDYAVNADASTFYTRDRPEAPRPDIARMKGRRMVTAAEGKAGKFLDEGLVKNLTGGEKVTARFLFGREFEFVPTAKLMLHTNHLPRITDRDEGIWRRPYPIPFAAVIPEEKRVKDYDKVLVSEEGSGILNWMLDGLAEYRQAKTLLFPRKVRTALDQYKLATDILAEFLEGFIITGLETDTITRSELWNSYKLSVGTDKPFSKGKFNSLIEERLGVPAKRSNDGYVWIGIRTKKDKDRQAGL